MGARLPMVCAAPHRIKAEMLPLHEACLANCSDEEFAQSQRAFVCKRTGKPFKSHPLMHTQLLTAAPQHRVKHRADVVPCDPHQGAIGRA